MFVAILSSTIVSNALPTIIADLHGSQTGYTWVVTATLLTTTVTTPIWGKLADLLSKKLLVQIAIMIFIVGSVGAGLAGSMGSLIGWRAVQGIGAGGLQALAQVVIAALIPPRERGRYSGYIGRRAGRRHRVRPAGRRPARRHPGLGWRWCFFVGVPVGLIALVVLQRTLQIADRRARRLQLDYLGAALITGGVSALLIWVSLAGEQFAWGSATSLTLAGLGRRGAGRGGGRGAAGAGADGADVAVPRAHRRAGRAGQPGRRPGDVRRLGVPRPVLPDRPLATRRPRPGCSRCR